MHAGPVLSQSRHHGLMNELAYEIIRARRDHNGQLLADSAFDRMRGLFAFEGL